MQKEITTRREQVDSLQSRIKHLEESMEKLQQVRIEPHSFSKLAVFPVLVVWASRPGPGTCQTLSRAGFFGHVPCGGGLRADPGLAEEILSLDRLETPWCLPSRAREADLGL